VSYSATPLKHVPPWGRDADSASTTPAQWGRLRFSGSLASALAQVNPFAVKTSSGLAWACDDKARTIESLALAELTGSVGCKSGERAYYEVGVVRRGGRLRVGWRSTTERDGHRREAWVEFSESRSNVLLQNDLDVIYFKWAKFSAHSEVTGMEVVLCAPEHADGDITNAENLVGKMAAVYRSPERGGCSFQEKTERLIGAGAVGVIIINTEDELLKAPLSAEVPMVMIQAKDAKRLLASGNSTCLRDVEDETLWNVSVAESDVIGLACDLKEGKLSWSLNGEWGASFSLDVDKVSNALMTVWFLTYVSF